MVVEDDLLVRMPVEETLTQAGFECAATARVEEAETLLADRRNRFRALLTDTNLKGEVDGWELARRARRVSPGLPVIYMSGAKTQLWAVRGGQMFALASSPLAVSSPRLE